MRRIKRSVQILKKIKRENEAAPSGQKTIDDTFTRDV